MTTTVCLGEDEKNLAKTEKFRLRNAPFRNKKKKQKNKSPVRFGFNQNLTPESFRKLPKKITCSTVKTRICSTQFKVISVERTLI